jgi:drug/metabolite transporter (DMT)-like permease
MAAMGFTILALAFASIFITRLERAGVPPITIAFYRMALATCLLAPAALAFKWREILSLSGRDLRLLALGGLFLALHFGAWITSFKYIPIATSVVLVNSHPLFVVIASYFFLGDRPTRRDLTGTAIGLAGMAIISHDGFTGAEFALLGDSLAILGALAIVGYFIVGRKARARVSLLAYVTPLYAFCSVILLVWALGSGSRLYPYDSTVWFYFLALAVVPTILGHTVFNWAIKHVRPSAISVAFLGEPVVASLLALLLFGQQPSLSTLIGGVFVLGGVCLTTSTGGRPGVEQTSGNETEDRPLDSAAAPVAGDK